MKIEVDVPDWAEGRHIYIFAGVELLAYKHFGKEDFKIKTDRCNLCGKCCMSLPETFIFRSESGNCEYLQKNKECSLGVFRPFLCSVAEPKARVSDCSCRFA